MTPEEALEVWAPQGSPWSPWTKPVLFSFLPAHLTEAFHKDVEPEQTIPLLQDAALVVELPGKRECMQGYLSQNEAIDPYLFTTPPLLSFLEPMVLRTALQP